MSINIDKLLRYHEKQKEREPVYNTKLGEIKLSRILTIGEYSEYKNESIEIIVANHIKNFDNEDWFELAKNYNIFEKLFDEEKYLGYAYLIYGGLYGVFNEFKDEIITKLINNMFSYKELNDMYSLILTGKLN